MSIHSRMVVALLGFTLLLMGVGFIGLYSARTMQARTELMDQVHALAELHAETAKLAIEAKYLDSPDQAEDLLLTLEELDNVRSFALKHLHDSVKHSQWVQDLNSIDRESLQLSAKIKEIIKTKKGWLLNNPRLSDGRPQDLKTDSLADLVEDLSDRYNAIPEHLRVAAQMQLEIQLVSIGMGVSFIFILIIWWTARRQISQPIRALRQVSQQVHSGNLQASAPVNGVAEVRELSIAFNEMIQWLREDQQALINARKEAERANEVKGQFLGTMSHELRTPLNAIIGYSELLEEQLLESDQHECLKDVSKIRHSGQHLLALISDILDLEKLDSEMAHLEIMPIDAGKMLGEIRDTILPLANRNHNQFIVDSSQQFQIVNDPTRLKQILLNLLSNACKFTHEGVIELRLKKNDGQILFEVEDSGIGMTPAQAQNVFQAFEQADSSTTRKYGGTGLGLTISQKLAHLMGGEITLTSEKNKGTCFTLTIPTEIQATSTSRS